ncbi:RNA-binding protein [Candidatus Woesearchaeota archaeon]|nr:RNA-binding protein [Candidatus Woesearchaeota archaeon]HLC80607.1 zinc finger domain-containing protein [Candidatus Nanoarchaeia archaeon]
MEKKQCASCKREIASIPGSVSFKCPACGKYEIVRCSICRLSASKYHCPACSFVGPN